MRRLVVGFAAVLVMMGSPARAEEAVAASAVLATGVPTEVQGAAEKPTASEGAAAKLGAVVATDSSATLLMAVSLAKDLAVPPLPPPNTLLLKVDLRAQNVTVMEHGAVKFVWPISSGREGYATQTGTFQPQWTARMWYSRQWDMAPMPHAVFFNRGTAFHATSATGSLGRRASHGCIRLAPGNAARLYALVHKHGLELTKVVVHSAPKEPAVARGKSRSYDQASARRGRYQGQVADTSYPAKQRKMRPTSGSAWGF